MKRRLVIALVAAGVGATVAVMAQTFLADVSRAKAQIALEQAQLGHMAGAQPDTTSSSWRYLSGDVGILLRDDDRLGLRGRLYVRVGDRWWPVATDGPAEYDGDIPAR